MLETSSSKFPANRNVGKGLPFLIRLNFGELIQQSMTTCSKAIVCEKCGAFLSDTDCIISDSKMGSVFDCVFCGTMNRLNSPPESLAEEMELLLPQKAGRIEEESVVSTGLSGAPWIACIDVSGSMGGEPILAVKRSLSTTIDSLASTECAPSFGLIEFGSHVGIRNFTDGSLRYLRTDSYYDIDSIIKSAKELIDNTFLADMKTDAESCKEHVNKLEARGGTALGPALVTSLVLAASCKAEKVVVLTDGMANVGLGALEGPTANGAELYRWLGNSFKRISTSVDTVGVVSGQDLQLRTLGIMSRISRGNMYYVGAEEIETTVDEISQSRSIARDLRLRLIGSDSVKFSDVTGIDHSEKEELLELKQTTLTSVTSDDEVYIAVEGDEITDEDVPIQLQVSHLDNNGQRHLRVLTRKLPVVTEEKEFIHSMNPTIPATYAVQRSGATRLFSNGEEVVNADKAMILEDMANTLLEIGVDSEDPSTYAMCARKLRGLIGRMREKLNVWDSHYQCRFSPPTFRLARQDYEFVSALRRSRMTRAELFGHS